MNRSATAMQYFKAGSRRNFYGADCSRVPAKSLLNRRKVWRRISTSAFVQGSQKFLRVAAVQRCALELSSWVGCVTVLEDFQEVSRDVAVQ